MLALMIKSDVENCDRHVRVLSLKTRYDNLGVCVLLIFSLES